MATGTNKKNAKGGTWFEFVNKEEVRAKIAVVAVFFVLLFFSVYTFKTDANVTEFYFSSCLGKWRNPENAVGKPTIPLESSQEKYDLGNSAVLYSDLTEIFCGGLDEEIPKDHKLEKTTLKLAIAFSNDPLRNASPVDETPVETSVDTEVTEESSEEPVTDADENFSPSATSTEAEEDLNPILDEDTDTSTSSVIEVSETQESDEVPSEAEPITFNFIKRAQAEEPIDDVVVDEDAPSAELDANVSEEISEDVVETEPEPEPVLESTEETSETTSDTNDVGEITEEESPSDKSEDAETTEDVENTEGTNEAEEEQIEEEYFMEIYYTLDGGRTLELLDRISTTNWQGKQFEYEVPITTWEDLEKFQVSIHGVMVVDRQPIVYLDSAWLSVTHTDTNSFETTETDGTDPGVESGLYSDVVKTENFEVDQAQDFSLIVEETIICDVEPFSQSIFPGGSARYQVNLSDKLKPYRLTFGQLPSGISITTEEFGDVIKEVFFVIEATGEVETGSFNVSLLYEALGDESKVDQSTCQFNVVVGSR